MDVTHISDQAFAVMAQCSETKQPFGITVDPQGHVMKLVWAFKMSAQQGHRERFDERHVSGSIALDPNFPGCPYCGSKQFVVCGNCGTVSCYHGQELFTCPSCGIRSTVEQTESIDLKGGGI